MFIRPEMKVVTIEEVRELRLHENWIPMVTRPSFQPGVQEVTPFDLLKSSLRQRPDYIVVGEIRGGEAYTLFQSISVGHGGLCTIHAENVEAVEKRLLTKPMNIPSMLIPMMNVIVLIGRTKLRGTTVRRAMDVSEITGVDDKTGRAMFKKVYEWDSGSDSFIFSPKSASESYVFKKINAYNWRFSFVIFHFILLIINRNLTQHLYRCNSGTRRLRFYLQGDIFVQWHGIRHNKIFMNYRTATIDTLLQCTLR